MTRAATFSVIDRAGTGLLTEYLLLLDESKSDEEHYLGVDDFNRLRRFFIRRIRAQDPYFRTTSTELLLPSSAQADAPTVGMVWLGHWRYRAWEPARDGTGSILVTDKDGAKTVIVIDEDGEVCDGCHFDSAPADDDSPFWRSISRRIEARDPWAWSLIELPDGRRLRP